MPQIKLIAIDLDSTLLTSEKKISPYTKRILAETAARGILVVPATGRPHSGIPREVMEIPGLRYVLSSNGARVVDLKAGETVIEHLIPLESTKRAMAVFDKYDTWKEIYFDGQGYAEKSKRDEIAKYHHDPSMWEYTLSTRIFVDDLEKLILKENEGMDKIHAVFANVDERELAWEELSKSDEWDLSGILGYNIELNIKGVNKGTTLQELGELTGIPMDEMMAFGDNDNDLSMLEKAGTGVAMKNGIEVAKEAADQITEETNEEDGVAKTIARQIWGEEVDPK